jgi:uncharacterized protein (DUF2164 family)
MGIKLGDERRGDILAKLGAFYKEIFDEELSDYQSERLLDFFMRELGPPVYNQAVQDARKFILEKLEDLDAEHTIPEDSPRKSE